MKSRRDQERIFMILAERKGKEEKEREREKENEKRDSGKGKKIGKKQRRKGGTEDIQSRRHIYDNRYEKKKRKEKESETRGQERE